MFQTLTIPASLYPSVLSAIVGKFEMAQPRQAWTDYELVEATLQRMREVHASLGEVTAVLDQLSWSATPREIAITADGGLLRSILNDAIGATCMAFHNISDGSNRAEHLDRYDRYTAQLHDLTELLRAVAHDHDQTEAAR